MIFSASYRQLLSAFRNSSAFRYIPVALVLCLGGGLSLVASAIVWKWERESLQAEFQRRSDNLATTLERKIDEYLQINRSLGAFYDASPVEPTRQSIKNFSQLFFSRYPGIYSMGFTKRVSAEERKAYEQAIQAEGFANFSILDRDANGKFVPARERKEYFAITYIEPLEKRKQVMGYDISVEPERKAALEKARDTGNVVATERIALANGKAAFILYRPVYRKGGARYNVSARRQSFKGHVFNVFALADAIQYSLQGLKIPNIDFYLYDEFADADHRFLVYYDSSRYQIIEASKGEKPIDFSASRLFCPEPTTCTHTFFVADRIWSLVFVPTPAYTGFQIYGRAGFVLISGLLLTSSLAIYLLISLRYTRRIENLVQERTEQTRQLRETLCQLQQTQAHLIQTEKMSSLGQLVAGIAHEINNPINFIYGNITYARSYIQNLLEHVHLYQQEYTNPSVKIKKHAAEIDLEFLSEDSLKSLSSMQVGADRIRAIVLSLRNFSRLDEAEMKPVDLHEGIESTLLILQSRLKSKLSSDRDIKIIKEYGDLPVVECYVGQLNQVFMNIIGNAIEALEEKRVELEKSGSVEISYSPWIKIRTELVKSEEKASNDKVAIWIGDNGCGISEKVRSRIFDPFFTTKPVGKATGLGLSIGYKIVVEKHGGKLECISAPGQGTEFCIEIPVQQSQRNSSEQKKLEV